MEKQPLYGPAKGREMPDAKPMEIPVGFKRPETLAEQVQRLVRTQLSQEAAQSGLETFEEANDFDIADDPIEPGTPYEEEFDPVLGRGITPAEMRENPEEYRELFHAVAKTMTRSELFELLGVDPDEGNGAAAPAKAGSVPEGDASAEPGQPADGSR